MTTRWWLLESSILLFSLFFCGWYSKRAFYDPCTRLCCQMFMPPPLGAGGIMFSGCPSVRPSVRPKPEIPSFDLYMGPLVQPTNRDRFTACPSVPPSVCPSVRPERFPGICRRTHEGNGLKCFWHYFHFVKRVKFGVSGHFPENA